MKPFEIIHTTAVPLLIDNIDTDQIIPARFLKTTVKTGIGQNLFRDWRYNQQNEPNTDFILNQDGEDGKILLAADNFGCGSSREHAVWALQDYGFRAVLAKSFADIFKQNALNNGLLPIIVTEEFWNELILVTKKENKKKITVELEYQSVKIENGPSTNFDIDPFRKECILKGYSDLDYLVSIKDKIEAFEANHVISEVK